MQVNKYEFIEDDTVTTPDGTRLTRIRALIDIPGVVDAGQSGGYIESEKSLSHMGRAWVRDDARVFGNAQIIGNALIYGNAQIFGNAWVSDDAQVFDNGCVYGNAQVFFDAQVSGNAQVFDDAMIFSDARIFDHAWVCRNARVYGKARIFGNAVITGDARVYDSALVCGDAHVTDENAIIWFPNLGAGYDTLTCYRGQDNNLLVTYGIWHGTDKQFLETGHKCCQLIDEARLHLGFGAPSGALGRRARSKPA